MNRRELLTRGLASIPAAALAPFSAFGQAKFPERPIRLVVPFSAGGVNDIVGRQWADRMRPVLGSVYVENQGGAGGTIAVVDVMRSQPDGHTVLLGSTSTMVLNTMTMSRLPYDPNKDFEPIYILCASATSIVVHASVPAKIGAGAHRLCQGQSRQAVLRLGRDRHHEPSVRRAVQADSPASRTSFTSPTRAPAPASPTSSADIFR